MEKFYVQAFIVLILGSYGRPAGPISEELKVRCDEDVLTYALFPAYTKKYLKAVPSQNKMARLLSFSSSINRKIRTKLRLSMY